MESAGAKRLRKKSRIKSKNEQELESAFFLILLLILILLLPIPLVLTPPQRAPAVAIEALIASRVLSSRRDSNLQKHAFPTDESVG